MEEIGELFPNPSSEADTEQTEPEYEALTKVPVNPITRRQKFLAAIAGDAELPEPITETEKLLYNIAITIMSLAHGKDPLVADNDLVVDNGDVMLADDGKDK